MTKREIPQHIHNAIFEIAEFCNKSKDCPECSFYHEPRGNGIKCYLAHDMPFAVASLLSAQDVVK
jgi:hypothetical protein